MKEFELEELKQLNGDNGKPIYVAHQGKVYDVSNSKMWKGGLHMKRHHAWTLFKKSSYYPLALLILVTVRLKT